MIFMNKDNAIIMMSNKTHFHVNGVGDKQNDRY